MGKIREWKASYYSDMAKGWIYGRFIIYSRFVRFVDRGEDSNDVDLKLYFDDFLELRKETTGIFFAAIAIRIKNVKYWFSSFNDRGYVFNTVEHFWKERLFTSGEGEIPRNTEFLSMLYKAQDTLASTGQTVLQQGHQIDATCSNMNRIHNDLDVGETIIHSLDSWLDKWNIETPHVQIDVLEKRQMVEKEEYPIVYAKNHKEKHLPGTLVISCQSVVVLNAAGNLDYCFAFKDITEIIVFTPWELMISKLEVGKVDYSVHFISARLIFILQTLEKLLPAKIISYDEPPDNVEHEDECEIENLQFYGGKEASSSSKNTFSTKSTKEGPSSKAVSDAEAAEMTRVLQDMKSLALGIQDEQNRQLQQLDYLSDSVDKANERLRKDSRNVKKLT